MDASRATLEENAIVDFEDEDEDEDEDDGIRGDDDYHPSRGIGVVPLDDVVGDATRDAPPARRRAGDDDNNMRPSRLVVNCLKFVFTGLT